MLGQILQPFSYLSIRHSLKWKVDWLFPFVLSVLCVGAACVFVAPDAAGGVRFNGVVINSLLGFLQCLPGFYIAALAAIATFGSSSIDEVMPSPPPKIVISVRGEDVTVDLTRRRFLAMLFSFLTCLSICLVIFTALYSPSTAIISGLAYGEYLFVALDLIYFLFFFQLIVATFWGLFYLGNRIHMP